LFRYKEELHITAYSTNRVAMTITTYTQQEKRRTGKSAWSEGTPKRDEKPEIKQESRKLES
jgi:hypothetical protein